MKNGQYVLIRYDEMFLSVPVKIDGITQPNDNWKHGLIMTHSSLGTKYYSPKAILKTFDTIEENMTALESLEIYAAVKKQHKIELEFIRKQLFEKVGIKTE